MVPVLPKTQILFTPTSVATNATAGGTATTAIVDTKGFDYVIFRLHTTSGAATETPSVLKIQEADVTNTSSLANVSGYVGGTDFTAPAPYTSAALATVANYAVIGVPLQGRKRYLTLVYTPGVAQTVRIESDLYRGESIPDSASEGNVKLAYFGP